MSSGSVMLCPLLVAADQVEKGEQVNPDDVDKVPVQAKILDKRHVPGCVSAGLRPVDHEAENRDTDNHMQCVHAGHRKVEEEVQLRVASHIHPQWLVVVLLVDFRIRSGVDERLHAVPDTRDVMLFPLLRILNGLNAKED